MDLDKDTFSKIIRINSHDREFDRKNQSNSNFTLNVPSYASEFSKVVALQVIHVSLPNVFYNIPEGRNSWSFQVGASEEEITIPSDMQYSAASFMAALQLAFNANVALSAFGVTTITLDPVTFKLSFVFPTNTISWVSDQKNYLSVKSGFGFSETEYSGTNIFVTPSTIALSGPSIAYIRSNQLSANSSDFDRSGDVGTICYVALDNAFGEMCFYNIQDSTSSLIRYRNARNITNIDIRLSNKFGLPLDVGEHGINIIAKIYYKL